MCVTILSIMPLQFTTCHGGIPETVMLDYRAIAVDISFELIPIAFAARPMCFVHKHKHILSDKLSRILVG